MKGFRNRSTLVALAAAGILLCACEKEEVTSYTIPKEERNPGMSAPERAPAPAPVQDMQVLPGMQAQADAAGTLSWTVPGGWQELPATGMRKGSFKVTRDNGSADVSVLAFPGDVGGALANINRWLGQIGRPPVDASQLDTLAPQRMIAGNSGRYVRLEGPEKSIIGGFVRVADFTWYIKMLGDTATVLGETEAMDQFLDSIEVPATAN